MSGPWGAFALPAPHLRAMSWSIFCSISERSGVSQSSTSGLLCLAIFGGALLPMTVGSVADGFGLSAAFSVPLAAYAFIAFFAFAARERILLGKPMTGVRP